MAKVTLSKKYALQWMDAVRGGLLAALSSVLTLVYDLLSKGDLNNINWKSLGITGITVFVGYLLKNGLLEPAKVITTVDTNKKAENATATIKEAVL